MGVKREDRGCDCPVNLSVLIAQWFCPPPSKRGGMGAITLSNEQQKQVEVLTRLMEGGSRRAHPHACWR